eukprot:1194666-Prorocentrum_minimum.AAC.5
MLHNSDSQPRVTSHASDEAGRRFTNCIVLCYHRSLTPFSNTLFESYDRGVQALLGGLATLATLNLRGCNRMRNEGVRALTHLSSLTRLTLSYNNRVTAEGLRSLGALSRPPRDERDARAGHALLAHGARPLHRVASERGRPPPFGPLTESRLPRAQLLRPFQPGRAGRAGRPQQSGPPKPQPLLGADGRAAR